MYDRGKTYLERAFLFDLYNTTSSQYQRPTLHQHNDSHLITVSGPAVKIIGDPALDPVSDEHSTLAGQLQFADEISVVCEASETRRGYQLYA